MKLKIAFAVNSNSQFEKNHFGDSHKFLIYEADSGNLKLFSEEVNVFRDLDEFEGHGSVKKGLAIIDFLKKKGVKVLVSMQFGKNIRMINEHFAPVIIYSDKPEQVIHILNHHMHWIVDELEKSSSNYSLFTIKSGILKTVVKK